MKQFRFRQAIRFLGFGILAIGLIGLIVMSLWNALLPAIVGVSVINFWQALGLLLLSRILFGGRPGFGYRGGWGDGPGRRGWKQKMSERWQQMTPEQREQMKQQWRNRCGGRGRWNWDTPEAEESSPNDPTSTTV